ncbi:MAG: 16S rRNA (guanine(966)-N(2))-methyltransferase RsmD [Acidobacteriota bacterium]
MENRRQQTATGTSKDFERKPYIKKEGERPPQGYRKFQPRDDRFQPRNNRFEGKDERTPNDRSQNGRPPGKSGTFQSKDDKFQPKGRFNPKGKPFKPWEKENRPRIVSDMQITDGKHRGKYLKSTTSSKVRPTARRVREVMFRILFRRVRAGRFLDLCAGAGTVGIEAISRGAIVSTFVERSSKMCSFIKKNLESIGIKEGHGEVVEMEVVPFLKRMAKRRRQWDVVYYDPPYNANYDEVLTYFGRGVAIRPGGTLVIEHHTEMFFPEKVGVMKRWRVLLQGETALSFYERK